MVAGYLPDSPTVVVPPRVDFVVYGRVVIVARNDDVTWSGHANFVLRSDRVRVLQAAIYIYFFAVLFSPGAYVRRKTEKYANVTKVTVGLNRPKRTVEINTTSNGVGQRIIIPGLRGLWRKTHMPQFSRCRCVKDEARKESRMEPATTACPEMKQRLQE